MASFTYTVIHIYNATDNAFIATDDEPGVATDGDADTTFDIGDSAVYDLIDPITEVPFTATAAYEGFIDFAGLSLPVAFVPASELPGSPSLLQVLYPDGAYIVADPRDPLTITVPDTLDVASIDTGPFTVCFLPGTAIAMPTGIKAVETLAIGDDILTADGRTVTVKWIGRQTISTRFGPAARLAPVRVAQGALGNGLPHRDLCMTADHALMIDGALVNAGALVNGTTITLEPLDRFGGSYTVYHIETEAHDIILAEGTPTETFVDYAGRQAFDNYAEYVALYGEDRSLPEMAQPRITSARQLPPHVRARLGIDRAA